MSEPDPSTFTWWSVRDSANDQIELVHHVEIEEKGLLKVPTVVKKLLFRFRGETRNQKGSQ